MEGGLAPGAGGGVPFKSLGIRVRGRALLGSFAAAPDCGGSLVQRAGRRRCKPGLALGSGPWGKCVLCGQSETADFLSPHFLSILRLPDSACTVWEAARSRGTGPWGEPTVSRQHLWNGAELPQALHTKGLAFVMKTVSLDLNTSGRLYQE